jgi:hypothetical protein
LEWVRNKFFPSLIIFYSKDIIKEIQTFMTEMQMFS